MKRAIVFGASSGIGAELSKLLYQRGYRVGLVGRREDKLSEIAVIDSSMFVVKRLDLTNLESIPSVVDGLIDELGGVDLAVIASGCGEINRDLDFNVEQDTIALNVSGFTAVADYLYNFFNEQRGGHILGVTSVMGLRGSCAAPAYSATKAYQINYLESLRQRAYVERNNIVVTDVRPGSVDTAMMKGEGHFWISSPSEAATQILRAINSGSSVVYVSRRWRLIGWLLKSLPRAIFNRMGRL